MLHLMAHSVLCTIAKSVHESTHYTLTADKVTDLSNYKQFVVCLQLVDKETFEVSEDLIGLYQVDDITSATLFIAKRCSPSFEFEYSNCRGQCFNGANNMVGIWSGVATLIWKEEPRAILIDCYGHSLQLAVSDTVKQMKTMLDALDTINEISKLLKYSPKRDTLF